MSQQPKYKGVELAIGEQVLILPPMSCGIVEAFEPRLLALNEGTEVQPLKVVADLMHACLKRNYPDLPRDVVADHVDMDNWEECFARVLGQSGYSKWLEQQQQGATEGNAMATTEISGTGDPSTPTSLPASGGPSTTAEMS